MLPNTGNILDQLLGGFDPAASTSNGVGSGQSSGGPAFGSILAGALGSTGAAGKASGAPGDPQLMGIPLSMFGQLLTGIGVETAGLADASGDQSLLTAEEQLSSLLTEDGKSANSTSDETGLLKPEFAVSNQRLKALMAMADKQTRVNLSDGVYNVLEQSVNGDHLDLTLAPEDGTEPVKVSIPLELLARDATSLRLQGTLNTANRVALAGQENHRAAALGKLFVDLKLKTLEVKLEPSVESGGRVTQPVQFKLVAENAGHQVLIRSKLLLSQVQTANAFADEEPALPAIKSEGEPESDGKHGLKLNPDVITAKGQQVARPVHQLVAASRFDLADRFAQSNQEKLDNSTIPGEHAASARENLQINAQDIGRTSHIKLTLPDNLTTQLRPNGQSIMIRIEPDHLGPARLNLSLNHHGLTARVSVDSVAAKTVVEHSLDQLTEQLSRAGIHVDRIEVSLTGGDARERFFERRPLWINQQNGNRPFEDDEFDENQVIAPRPLPSQLRQYVGAGRVNLWA
jgi:flagellar hook-length control protein FliK